jgi:hypothetical protein
VNGKLSRLADGYVRVKVAVDLAGRVHTTAGHARAAHSRWHLTLTLPGIDSDPSAPTYTITATFGGSARVRGGRTKRQIRLEVEPAGLGPL